MKIKAHYLLLLITEMLGCLKEMRGTSEFKVLIRSDGKVILFLNDKEFQFTTYTNIEQLIMKENALLNEE